MVLAIPDDQVKDVNNNADHSGDNDNSNGADMNSPAVFALVIIYETR